MENNEGKLSINDDIWDDEYFGNKRINTFKTRKQALIAVRKINKIIGA